MIFIQIETTTMKMNISTKCKIFIYYLTFFIFHFKNLCVFFVIFRNKRNDIEARLLELQAEIELAREFEKMPAGHGKFNFDDM